MKWLKALLANIWKIYFLLVVVLVILILYPVQCILLTNEKYFPKGFQLIRFQAKLILFLTGIRYSVEGHIPNDDSTSYIICPNHSSYLDILLLYATLPTYFIFLGKKELGSVPVFNIYFKKMNILLDRSNAKAAHASIISACERLNEGANIIIFPEGTIPTICPKMKPFKNGAFRASVKNNIPILPITFSNNYRLLEDSWNFYTRATPGKSKIHIHPPIFPNKGEIDLLTLRELTREAIASKLED